MVKAMELDGNLVVKRRSKNLIYAAATSGTIEMVMSEALAVSLLTGKIVRVKFNTVTMYVSAAKSISDYVRLYHRALGSGATAAHP